MRKYTTGTVRVVLPVISLMVSTMIAAAQTWPGTHASLTSAKTASEGFEVSGAVFSGDSTPVLGQKRNALGIDLLVSNSGFGLGGFYRRQYSDDLYGFATLSISEAKDDREVEVYDYFRGEFFTPGKVNRFILVPLFIGVQKRLFREEVADNFRPYVTAALGPTLVYSAPYDREFFNSLGHGQAHYTLGGYVGFGAFFGVESGNLVGVSFRYYFVPLKNQVESLQNVYKKQFGGFFITLNVGTVY
jgi:hypothetical protein